MHTSLPSAKKSLGQCFLVEKSYARDIAACLNLSKDDVVLEIGPGRGSLTEELLNSQAKIIAVEIDGRMIDPLKEKFGKRENFELWHQDFLDTDISKLFPKGNCKVVGNLPYHLSSEILFKLFDYAKISRKDTTLGWVSVAVLMMQQEVAVRVVSKEGKKDYGRISVFTQLEANANLMLTVPASAFRPQPKVDGGVVRLDFYKIPPAVPDNFQVFERIVRFCFSQRRKMLKGTLSQLSGIHPFWQNSNLDFTRRPETLSPQEWVDLANIIAKGHSPSEKNLRD